MPRFIRTQPPREFALPARRRGRNLGPIFALALMLAGDVWLLLQSGILDAWAGPPVTEEKPLPPPPVQPVQAAPSAVQDATLVTFGDLDFHIVEVDSARQDLRLFWKDAASGERYGRPGVLEASLKRGGETLLFATNAGMFQPDYRPVGLHVEEGKEWSPLDERSGLPGNFYLAPNGVFFVRANGQPGIQTTDRFARERPADIRLATQSGPMLVVGGRIHDAFNPRSESRFVRSGVGWKGGTRLVFALSAEPVTFFEFARFFLEKCGCPDALYLDGAISRFHVPSAGHPDPGGDFAGMLGVVLKETGEKTSGG